MLRVTVCCVSFFLFITNFQISVRMEQLSGDPMFRWYLCVLSVSITYEESCIFGTIVGRAQQLMLKAPHPTLPMSGERQVQLGFHLDYMEHLGGGWHSS
jgi:hypothetical protein